MITVRPLSAENASDFRDIRLAALQAHPEAFSADYETESNRSLQEWADRLGRSRFFGAFDGGHLIGIIGLTLNSGTKTGHTGKLISMYVSPSHRGKKVGDQLIDTLTTTAADHVEQLHLSCATTNLPAKNLYERNGFTVYGIEPRIMKIGDTYYDEYLMVRDLRA